MREFIDGFETGDCTLWETVTGISATVVSASSYGMSGSKCLSPYRTRVTKNITSRDGYYFAFKFRFEVIENVSIAMFLNNGSTLGSLYLSATGKLQLNSGVSTVCSTGSKTLNINTVYLIEIFYQPKTDGTGRFVLKTDGILESDFTGVTSPLALQINQFSLGTTVSTAGHQYFDDIIVDSDSWIGPSKIQALVPTGAGNTTQWTPSSGANYTCVDEVPASDTDYVATNTAANIDTYALSDLVGMIGSVKSVQLIVRGSYSGAPATTSLKGIIQSGGTNYPSASTIALSTSPTPYASLWENDPATSTAWTASGVNSMEAGIKAV